MRPQKYLWHFYSPYLQLLFSPISTLNKQKFLFRLRFFALVYALILLSELSVYYQWIPKEYLFGYILYWAHDNIYLVIKGFFWTTVYPDSFWIYAVFIVLLTVFIISYLTQHAPFRNLQTWLLHKVLLFYSLHPIVCAWHAFVKKQSYLRLNFILSIILSILISTVIMLGLIISGTLSWYLIIFILLQVMFLKGFIYLLNKTSIVSKNNKQTHLELIVEYESQRVFDFLDQNIVQNKIISDQQFNHLLTILELQVQFLCHKPDSKQILALNTLFYAFVKIKLFTNKYKYFKKDKILSKLKKNIFSILDTIKAENINNNLFILLLNDIKLFLNITVKNSDDILWILANHISERRDQLEVERAILESFLRRGNSRIGRGRQPHKHQVQNTQPEGYGRLALLLAIAVGKKAQIPELALSYLDAVESMKFTNSTWKALALTDLPQNLEFIEQIALEYPEPKVYKLCEELMAERHQISLLNDFGFEEEELKSLYEWPITNMKYASLDQHIFS